jgi:hypothetical protein
LLLGQGFSEDEGQQDHYTDQSYLKNDSESRGTSPLCLQSAAGFQKAIFEHEVFSYFRPYVNLDTNRVPFAPEINHITNRFTENRPWLQTIIFK